MRTRAGVLVGRAAELTAALDLVRDAARGGGAPACFWTGEPGVGKSRLLAEAAERSSADGVLVVRGRASMLGPVSPLRPFAEALASIQRRGLLPDDDLGGYRAVLGRVLPRLGEPGAGGRETPPLLAFAEAVLRVLTVLGGTCGGCLLVLEDLHDADLESLAVLEYLLDNIDAAPVAVLGALRDEPGAARQLLALAQQRGVARWSSLRPLDRPDTELLVGACLGVAEPAPDLVELIWRNSSGNPLLVEELLHDLLAGGRLGPDGLGVPPDAVLAPPPSMLQLVSVRLDRMEPAVRRVLIAAAVYGEHFPALTVAAAGGGETSGFWDALQVGLAQQLVVADSPGWYRFHHPLGHAAVLRAAGESERRQAAAALADAVLAEAAPAEVVPAEVVPAEAVPEDPALAEDSAQAAACRLAARLRADAGQPAEAARLYARSGRQALHTGAIEWATADLGEAFRLAPSRPELAADLNGALVRAGQLDRALELAGRLQPPGDGPSGAVRARIHLDLAQACNGAGRQEQAGEQLARARELAAGSDDEVLRLRCDAVTAILLLGPPALIGSLEATDPAGERLARSTAETADRLADSSRDPSNRQAAAEVACLAWQALAFGMWVTERIPESDACRERMAALVSRFRLPGRALGLRAGQARVRLLGDGDALPTRLLCEDARRLGAVGLATGLTDDLLLHELMVGEGSLAPVMASLTRQAEQAERMGNPAGRGSAVGALLLGAGLRADRAALTGLLARYRPVIDAGLGGMADDLAVAQAICLALENRDREALTMLEAYARDCGRDLNGSSLARGPLILLGTLAATVSPEEVDRALPTSGRIRWTRQFLHWAAAVHAGRSGDRALAASHAERAVQAAEIYPALRHLAARLTAPAAAAGGWGTPVEDVRAAEAWFHRNGVPVAARGCRDVLRALGVPVRYRRADADAVPARLRAAGVTTREYEVALLVCEHLDNRTIAQRLHISPRTVEKHVAALLAKLSAPHRRALIDHVAGTGWADATAQEAKPDRGVRKSEP